MMGDNHGFGLTARSSLVPRTAPISLRSLRSRLRISADLFLWWDVISCSVENSLWMASRLTWIRMKNMIRPLKKQQNPAGLGRNLEQDQVVLVDREVGAEDHVMQTAS